MNRSTLRLLALASMLAVAGCWTPPPPPVTTTYLAPVLAEPPPNSVRIKAEKVQEGDHKAVWKWSLRGDRMWTGISLDTPHADFVLTDSLSMTHAAVSGSGAWELQLELTSKDTGEATMDVEKLLVLKGIGMKRQSVNQPSLAFKGQSGGVEARTGGSLTKGMRRDSLVRMGKILIEGEQTLELPVQAPLFEFDWTTPEGKTERKVFTLSIDK